jgi:protein O-mannosyl-transferase
VNRFRTFMEHAPIVLILVAVPIFIFGQTLDFGFVWDDHLHLSQVQSRSGHGISNVGDFWTGAVNGLYIPVAYTGWTTLSLVASHLFDGPLDPKVYHAGNLALHTINGLLVFALLRLFIRSRWSALAGTLVFLVHPMQVESVAYASEFRGLLAASFGFAALLLHSHGRSQDGSSDNVRTLLLASVCFIMALLSKPSVAALPLVALAIHWALHRPRFRQLISNIWIGIWLAACGIIAVVTSSAQSEVPAVPIWAKPLIWTDTVCFYLYQVLVPVSLGANYGRTPQVVLEGNGFFLSWIIPVACAALLWRLRGRTRIATLAALIFLIGFLPVSGLAEFYFQNWSTVADRYLYVSFLGVALAFSSFTECAQSHWTRAVLLGLIVFMGVRSHTVQTPTWTQSISLWSHSLAINPNDVRALSNRGKAFNDRGEFDTAKADLDFAIEIDPSYRDAYINRGVAYSSMRMFDQAISDFNFAIARKPNGPIALNNRGTAWVKKGRFDQAIDDYTAAIEASPNWAGAHNNRGLAYDAKQDYRKAILDFDRAIHLAPGYSEVYMNRANVKIAEKDYDGAIEDLDRALAQQPRYTRAQFNRGWTYALLNKHLEAIDAFTQVIAWDPKNNLAYSARAASQMQRGDYEDALSDYNSSLFLKSDSPNVLQARARALFFVGRLDDAKHDMDRAKDLGAPLDQELLKLIEAKLSR